MGWDQQKCPLPSWARQVCRRGGLRAADSASKQGGAIRQPLQQAVPMRSADDKMGCSELEQAGLSHGEPLADGRRAPPLALESRSFSLGCRELPGGSSAPLLAFCFSAWTLHPQFIGYGIWSQSPLYVPGPGSGS